MARYQNAAKQGCITSQAGGRRKNMHEPQVPAACICLHWRDKEAWACLLARSCRYSAAFFTCCIHNDRQCLGNACAWKAFSLPFAEKAFLLSLEKRALLIHPENNFSATRPHINKHGPTSTSTQSTFPVPLSQSAGRAARQRKICRNKGQVCHFLTPPSPPPLVRGRIIRKCES